jgi:hypothetical protein
MSSSWLQRMIVAALEIFCRALGARGRGAAGFARPPALLRAPTARLPEPTLGLAACAACRFNIVSPGADADIYFPFSDAPRRLTALHPDIEQLLFDPGFEGTVGSLEHPDRPILFSMARLDKVKNLTGLTQWRVRGGAAAAGAQQPSARRARARSLHPPRPSTPPQRPRPALTDAPPRPSPLPSPHALPLFHAGTRRAPACAGWSTWCWWAA